MISKYTPTSNPLISKLYLAHPSIHIARNIYSFQSSQTLSKFESINESKTETLDMCNLGC